MSGGFNQFADSSESKTRHIVINGFVLSFGDQVSLMPDANIAAVADMSAKPGPGGQMGQIWLPRVAGQILEGSPVLQEDHRSAKPEVPAHKAKNGLALKFRQHPGHGQEYRQPLMNFPKVINPHPNQKETERAVHFGCHALG